MKFSSLDEGRNTSSWDGVSLFEPGSFSITGTATGTFWYIRERYVADNTLRSIDDDEWLYRVLTLTSGEIHSYNEGLYYYLGFQMNMEPVGDYADVVEFYNDHQF